MPDCVQQVGLSETGRPVDEQRVVRPGGALGHRKRGRVREAIRRADDELVERVARVQRHRASGAAVGIGGAGPLLRRCRRQGCIRSQGPRGHELLGPGRGVDEQLDRQRHPGEGLGRIGEQTQVAGADPLDRHRTGDTEHEGVLREVERMDTREPGVPRRLGELRAHGGGDLGPEIVRCWSAHFCLPPVVHRRIHTCGERPRRCQPVPTCRPCARVGRWGSSRRPGPDGSLGSRTIAALWTTRQMPLSGGIHSSEAPVCGSSGALPNPADDTCAGLLETARRAVHCHVHQSRSGPSRTSLRPGGAAPGPFFGPGVRGGHA